MLEDAKITPDQVRGIDDLQRLPFTTRDAWMDNQAEKPPYGDLVTAGEAAAIRYHTTSGTSGRTPLRVLDSRLDWKWISECWCYAFHGFGVRPTDRVFFAFSYGTFIGFWGAHYGTEKMGCLVLPSGNMNTPQRVQLIDEMNATVVCATPTYALRMAQEGTNLGIDLEAGSVKRLILSGEPAGSIPATKSMIEEQWGAKAADTAGMTEIGTIMMFECDRQPGGTHIIEDHFIEEVIDPETQEPVEYGEQGERVVTSFGRGMIPLIRYRTRDLVLKVPHTQCDCGRTWDVYEGGIRGRVDDMLLVRGTNVYPRAVEAIVREYPAVDEFQIHLYTADGIRDEIEILCELRDGYEEQWSAVARRLRQDLSTHNEGLGFHVDRVERETLPRFELKAKRVKDERVVKGS
jgi:phenylacetate-CoA ligase